MPRQPRIDIEGALYHVLNRGIRKERIFRESCDYLAFIDCLRKAREKYSFSLYCYVLMPNHFHILVERGQDSLSEIMKSVSIRYAVNYNRRYGRSGHLFQSRFQSIICDRESYFLQLVRYIHRNPVRAGLCSHPSGWKWSSYGNYTGCDGGLQVDTEQVLKALSTGQGTPAEDFRDFIEMDEDPDPEKVYPASGVPVAGDETFKAVVLKEKKLRRKTPESLRLPIYELADRFCRIYGVSSQELRSRGGKRRVSRGRAIFCYIASVCCGHKAVDIAQFLNNDHSAVSHAVSRIRKEDPRELIGGILRKI